MDIYDSKSCGLHSPFPRTPIPPPLLPEIVTWGSPAGGEEGARDPGSPWLPAGYSPAEGKFLPIGLMSHWNPWIPEHGGPQLDPLELNWMIEFLDWTSWQKESYKQHYSYVVLAFWKFPEISVPFCNLCLTDFFLLKFFSFNVHHF